MSRNEKFSYETSGNRRPVKASIVLDATELVNALPADGEPGPAEKKKEKKKAEKPRAQRERPAAPIQTEKVVEDMSKKKKKKRGGLRLLPVIAAVLALALLGGALVVFGVVPVSAGDGSNTYTVSDAETLAKYLRHPSLKSGDTLVINGALDVDVNALFDGFADIPLVNYDCAAGGVTFTGGGALLTGGASKVTMNGVKFVDCDVYMEAPASAVTWVDCTDDANINAKSLNGTAHAQTLAVRMAGARFTVPVTLTNNTASALSNVSVTLASTGFVFPDGESCTVKSIDAGATVTKDVEVVAVAGGRSRIIAYAADSAGALAVTGGSDYISVMGTGWYAGDVHTHTDITGRDATLENNVRYGYKNGMSFIVSSERNADAPALTQSDVDGIVGESNAFLQLGGYELCEDTSIFRSLYSYKNYTDSMDFLILGTDVVPSNHYIVPDTHDLEADGSLTPWMLQDSITEVDKAGGVSILTHFFDVNIETKVNMSKSFSGLDGLEVLTPHHGLDDMETRVALNVWKLYSTFGAEKTFAVAASNNETSEQVGTYFIKGRMNGLSESGAYAMLADGCYFFSNGPELSFTIGGADMGQSFATSAGAASKATFFACDDVPLTKLTLTRYYVTNSKNDITSEVIAEYDLTGKGMCSFGDTLDVTVSPKEYYILEVSSESDNLARGAGFAASNPVYAVEGGAEQTLSGKAVDTMRYLLGGKAQQAGNGSWYLTAKNYLPFLMRVSSAGNKVSVVYHSMKSDAVCDYLTVLVTGDDGSQSSQRVYLINS